MDSSKQLFFYNNRLTQDWKQEEFYILHQVWKLTLFYFYKTFGKSYKELDLQLHS